MMAYNRSKFKPEPIEGTPADATHQHRNLGGLYKEGRGEYALKFNVVNRVYFESKLTNKQLKHNSLYMEID